MTLQVKGKYARVMSNSNPVRVLKVPTEMSSTFGLVPSYKALLTNTKNATNKLCDIIPKFLSDRHEKYQNGFNSSIEPYMDNLNQIETIYRKATRIRY